MTKRAIVLIERNRSVAAKTLRALAAATAGATVLHVESLGEAAEKLVGAPLFFAIDILDLDPTLRLVRDQYPSSRVIVWSAEPTAGALNVAMREPRLAAVLGWPPHRSTPRAWEIAVAARRLVSANGNGPRVIDLLAWGGSSARFSPTNTAERDQAVAAMSPLAERWALGERVGERMADAAHELLMNAMYDAPVDANGELLYAMNRGEAIQLTGREVPTLRVACDGLHVGLEVTDQFGLLERGRMLGSILRGLDSSEGQVLDTSHGGAGLGMLRLYTSAASLLADVTYGSRTRVTWVYDLDLPLREQRRLPTSVHYFEPLAPTGDGSQHE